MQGSLAGTPISGAATRGIVCERSGAVGSRSEEADATRAATRTKDRAIAVDLVSEKISGTFARAGAGFI